MLVKSAFQIGTYTALGYVVVVAMTFPLSFMADYMINSGRFRVGTVRKLMNSFGYFGSAMGLVWLSLDATLHRLSLLSAYLLDSMVLEMLDIM